MVIPDYTTRLCKSCGNTYPRTVEYWYKDRNEPDGLSFYCKECYKARRKQERETKGDAINAKRRGRYHQNPEPYRAQKRNHRHDNIEAYRERDREYAATHREEARIRARRHYRDNIEAKREYARQYYRENSEKALAQQAIYTKQWRRDHPEAHRAQLAKRRARINASERHYTADDITQQRLAQTDKRGYMRCWWCGKPIEGEYHIDHIIPLARGGSNAPENICLAHPKCNQSKGTKTPQDLGRLF